MALKKSEALSQIRERLRDTVADYQYGTTLLESLLKAALREMESEIREVDPDFFLTRQVVKGYTDALDQGTYEFYPLPGNMSSLRWIERADGTFHPKLYQHTAREAEVGRFPGFISRGTLTIGGSTTSLPTVGAVESYSVWGNRFRVLPAPSAVGAEYGIYYDRSVVYPTGDNDLIDVPPLFEEPTILSTAVRALRLDGDPGARLIQEQFETDLEKAKQAQANRARRDNVLTLRG